jgi:hypothetical protein
VPKIVRLLTCFNNDALLYRRHRYQAYGSHMEATLFACATTLKEKEMLMWLCEAVFFQ